MSEKRRAGVLVSGSSSSSGCEADQEFVSRSGVSALLAGALLRLLDCRSGDPLGFLAEHFAHLSAEAEEGGAEQRSLSRALWMLSLQHHSQRLVLRSLRLKWRRQWQRLIRRRGTEKQWMRRSLRMRPRRSSSHGFEPSHDLLSETWRSSD
ncbi:tubulin polyglutamylase complex subunit 1 isoform X1 [Danio rerio]|uniref:Tubulin polyglutamylase complex subunit 1 isoform X1 n=1 Tax=Danio rerio TaxID=7955 RepID=A0AC58GQ65_DANRE